MLSRLKDPSDFNLCSEKDVLIREADEAFHAGDKTSCVKMIDRLYDLFDETLVSPRRGRRPVSAMNIR